MINGSCDFNGVDSNITGDACSAYADKKYIDTNVNLFSNENFNKDFELYFEISNYDSNNQSQGVSQQTIMNSLQEIYSKNQGIVLRRSRNDLSLLARNSKETKEININPTTLNSVKLVRKDMKLYYSLNEGELIYLLTYDDSDKKFDLPVTFGASLDRDGNPWRETKCTLSNMYIKMGDIE